MYVFKTSGNTFNSVIYNQKHAFKTLPQDWHIDEIVLVSKNKSDCNNGEKQIQYTMKLVDIQPIKPGEADGFWPGNEGRWNYLVICKDTKPLVRPFNLDDILGEDSRSYRTVMTFKKIDPDHKISIDNYLQKSEAR
jgi:hypothetical protein